MRMRDSFIPLFEKITEHSILLTPNRRLSATLHKLYQQQQIEHGKLSWPTPTILPLISWLQSLWLEDFNQYSHEETLLLNSIQEQFVWEKILLSTKKSSELLQISKTAQSANSAWKLLKQWQVDYNQNAFESTQDYKTFQEWARQFEWTCEKNCWLDSASLVNIISDNICNTQLLTPRHIMLVGFTELSPQLNYLFSTCKANGCRIETMNMTSTMGISQRIALGDQELEIVTMANWAKNKWMQQKELSIGCVISSLDRIRDRVIQIFSEVFAEENTYSIDPQTHLFNVSAGKPLIEYPIIYAALQILSLHQKVIHTELLSYLLSSPFLGEAQSEYIKRAHFDRFLRQHNLNRLDIHTFSSSYDSLFSLHKHCPSFAKRIQAFLLLLNKHQQNKTYYEWGLLFNQLLTTMGWPGERSLDSNEYQTVSAWLKLLRDMQSLDQVSAPVSFSYALHTLNNLVHNNIFQTKTPDAPIQVLGTLEAAGLSFDYLWISGLDHLNFPPQAKPNPFIPKSIQRDLNMPHATAERELTYCKQLVDEFKRSAHHLIFSHTERNQDIHLQASTLIEEIQKINLNDLNLPAYLSPSLRVFAKRQFESFYDEVAPPISFDHPIQGGVSILQQQALCPFKAFAEWRLHAKNLESRLPGLRNKDRGTLIHKILEIIWNELKDHHTLSTISSDELHTLVKQSISEALSIYHIPYQHRPKYLSLEQACLFNLILDWLTIEKNRPPFKVLVHESKREIQLDQLKLNLRIDRIDELMDGKKLIIDYKTSKRNEVMHWFSDRPEAPQLPLYALHDTNSIIGISYAQISSGEHCFKGISHYSLDIDGIKLVTDIRTIETLSWSEQLNQWDKTFKQLAHDFSSGISKVDPKHPQQTCTFCSLKPLCRIQEETSLDVN